MSRPSGRIAVDRECHVLGCTNDAGSRSCAGGCSHKVCALHYGKSVLCQSCSSATAPSIHADVSSFTIIDIAPEQETSKFKKSKLFKNYSDEAMLHLCKQVQLNQAHVKTGDTMHSKWEKVTNNNQQRIFFCSTIMGC